MDLLGAFIVLMVAGGLIAYSGDRLGYTMGKKRVSFLKMRPRHTATLFTVAAGAVAAAVALGFLLIVDQTFAKALNQGRALLTANHHLQRENTGLQRAEQDALRNAKNAHTESDQARQAAQTAQAQAAKAAADLKTTQIRLATAQTDVKKVQAQLQQRQIQLAKAAQDLTAAQARVQVALAESKHLEAEDQRLARENQQEAAAIGAQDTALRGKAFGTLLYRDTQEVGRVVIPAYQPQSVIHETLERFLNGLSTQAKQGGAARGDNGRSVVVATVRLTDQDAAHGTHGQDAQLVTETGSIDALATQIRTYGHGSVVVIASALGNAFGGKPVVIQLHPYANKLAIRGGTVLGETTVANAADSPDQIVSDLQQFLVTTIRPAAKRAGVIPVRDPQEHLGDVSLRQIYELVQRIQQIKGGAVITASAANDTYSADHLLLQFTVHPAAYGGTGVAAHVQP